MQHWWTVSFQDSPARHCRYKEKIQYDDNLVVQAEIFLFMGHRGSARSRQRNYPADKAGLNVLFVPSEEPYHERKVTLLNGPHTVLSPVAYLSEVNIVRDRLPASYNRTIHP